MTVSAGAAAFTAVTVSGCAVAAAVLAVYSVRLIRRQIRLFRSIRLVELKSPKVRWWVLLGFTALAAFYAVTQLIDPAAPRRRCWKGALRCPSGSTICVCRPSSCCWRRWPSFCWCSPFPGRRWWTAAYIAAAAFTTGTMCTTISSTRRRASWCCRQQVYLPDADVHDARRLKWPKKRHSETQIHIEQEQKQIFGFCQRNAVRRRDHG